MKPVEPCLKVRRMSNRSGTSEIPPGRGGRAAMLLALGCLLSLIAYPCVAQEQDLLCNHGSGGFQAEFHNTGITLRVGASRNGELATRRCEATFDWNERTLVVANKASQVDIDAFGIDLGFHAPVAALQVKKSDGDCCMEYQIYSLEKPPRLLQIITGGDFFSAADTDLDGRVEIWTHDAAAIDGLERLSLAELDSAPTIILRISRGDLTDVSREFQSYFDDEIARLRGELDADDLRAFKSSDGRLSSNGSFSAGQLHNLRKVKIKVLEIVLSYLYSDREQQAWRSLAELWPTTDIPRIRGEILTVRARGIAAQTKSISPAGSEKRTRHATIFDAINESPVGRLAVTPPQPILLIRPDLIDTPDRHWSQSESLLTLVIDSAGKVRSVEARGKSAVDPVLIHATAAWKFIPAFSADRAVACRMRLSVSPKQ